MTIQEQFEIVKAYMGTPVSYRMISIGDLMETILQIGMNVKFGETNRSGLQVIQTDQGLYEVSKETLKPMLVAIIADYLKEINETNAQPN